MSNLSTAFRIAGWPGEELTAYGFTFTAEQRGQIFLVNSVEIIRDNNGIYGNSGDNHLLGTAGSDHIFGGAGADRITGWW